MAIQADRKPKKHHRRLKNAGPLCDIEFVRREWFQELAFSDRGHAEHRRRLRQCGPALR